MPSAHHIHRRRSIRLKEYDYSQAGVYFLTICAHKQACLFGEIVDGKMRSNEAGRTVEQCWDAIPDHFPSMELDEFVAMPNHIHGIVVLAGEGVACNAPTSGPGRGVARNALVSRMSGISPKSGSLAVMIRSFKSAATQRINALRGAPGTPVWQRNYYEHIIRDEPELAHIREYIRDNPARWELDKLHPRSQWEKP